MGIGWSFAIQSTEILLNGIMTEIHPVWINDIEIGTCIEHGGIHYIAASPRGGLELTNYGIYAPSWGGHRYNHLTLKAYHYIKKILIIWKIMINNDNFTGTLYYEEIQNKSFRLSLIKFSPFGGVFFKKIASCFEKAKMNNHCSFLLNILLFIATMKIYKNTDYLNEINN